MKKKYLLLLFGLWSAGLQAQQPDKTLWYKQPAEHFEESLVLGNGTQGASVFGGVNSDKIYLNDATLWSGEPVNPAMNPQAYTHIPAIREALKNEDYKLADQLQRKLQGKFSESFAPLGTLFVNVAHQGSATNYYRELNLSNAISLVRYEVDGIIFTREYFISKPDEIMVIRLTASRKGALDFTVKFNSLLKNGVTTTGNVLSANGYAPIKAEP
ncbi:glycoside hydrolase family 95 protein, partial [Arsenicibacter rosenii]|uniref:glycoside hydrolase family 95 protein n=1 Tax=Arsenicibacter rosenii TaxID=1750698 RepID=UPI000A79C293